MTDVDDGGGSTFDISLCDDTEECWNGFAASGIHCYSRSMTLNTATSAHNILSVVDGILVDGAPIDYATTWRSSLAPCWGQSVLCGSRHRVYGGCAGFAPLTPRDWNPARGPSTLHKKLGI